MILGMNQRFPFSDVTRLLSGVLPTSSGYRKKGFTKFRSPASYGCSLHKQFWIIIILFARPAVWPLLNIWAYMFQFQPQGSQEVLDYDAASPCVVYTLAVMWD